MIVQDNPDAPIVKLVNAILLSALKKQASAVQIWMDPDGRSIVEFTIDGVMTEEMSPPPELHAPIVRRLGIMASLPMHVGDELAYGRIHLRLGERSAFLDLTVRGHGNQMRAQLAVHGFSERPPPFTPPGIPLDPPLR